MTNPETSSDLVKRLRQTARDFASNGIADEAATTIERLTEAVDCRDMLLDQMRSRAEAAESLNARQAEALKDTVLGAIERQYNGTAKPEYGDIINAVVAALTKGPSNG